MKPETTPSFTKVRPIHLASFSLFQSVHSCQKSSWERKRAKVPADSRRLVRKRPLCARFSHFSPHTFLSRTTHPSSAHYPWLEIIPAIGRISQIYFWNSNILVFIFSNIITLQIVLHCCWVMWLQSCFFCKCSLLCLPVQMSWWTFFHSRDGTTRNSRLRPSLQTSHYWRQR